MYPQVKRKHTHISCNCLAFFFNSVRSNASLKELLDKVQNGIGCICLIYLHCVFSYVSSNRLSEKMHNYIYYIWLTFTQYVLWNVSSNCMPEWMYDHTGDICLTSIHCEFCEFCELEKCPDKKMWNYTGCICWLSSRLLRQEWVFKWVLKLSAQEDALLPYLHLFCFFPLCVFKWVRKLLK